ncbi:hypothetical protein GWI33_002585 [Rhynchophorus ferrugineus]|uniref:Uncharacterized protein n=1 Tax=Rhynchophorus ferrugineus TaxID=354439 RepID=A0A834IYI4_RHYFE|nr:hypothetical protein GWI33_002585 [Rhynchophorus ferrugineus]
MHSATLGSCKLHGQHSANCTRPVCYWLKTVYLAGLEWEKNPEEKKMVNTGLLRMLSYIDKNIICIIHQSKDRGKINGTSGLKDALINGLPRRHIKPE